MSKILNFARGSYFVTDKDVSAGMVSIEGMDELFRGSTEGILVAGFQLSDQEKNAIIQCFGDTNHIYAFGHDPEGSGFVVTLNVFLGNRCMEDRFEDSGNLGAVVKAYNGARVSEKRDTVTVTLGKGVSLTGIVLSMNAAVADAGLNMVSVAIAGKTMYMKGGQ